MSRAWRGGSTTRWRTTRAVVLATNRARHAGRCQLNVGERCPRHHRPCPDVCTGTATQVHHLDGKAAGDNPERLVAACAACNRHVGDPATIRPRTEPPIRQVSKW